MNEQLIRFIELCLIDGNITDKEREVIFRKAGEYGVPQDECEIILEGMIIKRTQEGEKKNALIVSDHQIEDTHLPQIIESKNNIKAEATKLNAAINLLNEINTIKTAKIPAIQREIDILKTRNTELKQKINENKELLYEIEQHNSILKEKIHLKKDEMKLLEEIKYLNELKIGDSYKIIRDRKNEVITVGEIITSLNNFNILKQKGNKYFILKDNKNTLEVMYAQLMNYAEKNMENLLPHPLYVIYNNHLIYSRHAYGYLPFFHESSVEKCKLPSEFIQKGNPRKVIISTKKIKNKFSHTREIYVEQNIIFLWESGFIEFCIPHKLQVESGSYSTTWSSYLSYYYVRPEDISEFLHEYDKVIKVCYGNYDGIKTTFSNLSQRIWK